MLIREQLAKFPDDFEGVLLLADGAVREIRHLPNTFSLSRPYRYA